MDDSSTSHEARPAMLLSSLVQTRSIELVLAPIASQVSQLIILTETRGSPFPNLEPTALSVMDAVQNLADVGKKIAAETSDEKLQKDLPVAYGQALLAGQQLVEAARALARDPTSAEAQVLLHTAAQGILEGTMKVLLVWDEAEVCKIIRAAHWTLDRLGLVKVAKSMRSLVICFGGLSEAMTLLLSLADKRQKELTDQKRKEQVFSALTTLKTSLPPFSEAMKKYVRNPSDVPSQNLRNARAGEVSSAIHELISAVRTFDEAEFTDSEPDNMVTNIKEVHRQLAPDSRYFIGSDLDKHLDAILQNSMAVAHVSRERYREAILRLCSEVLALRKELGDHLTAVTSNPESVEARTAFDQTAEQLCEKLCEIDRWVADAVVDQVTEAFVEPAAPINHLVQAAAGTPTTTSPGSSPDTSPTTSPRTSGRESDALTRQVELFRRHSHRLSQVATHAAQSSADSKRVQLITELASQVDQVMPQVVEAALAVRKAPGDVTAKSRLDAARKDWAEKVQQLTTAIDDIIDPEDFMAVSEANIHQDMTKCRDAVKDKNWPLMRMLVQGVAAKAKRVAEVGRLAVEQAQEPGKKAAITAAVARLEHAIPQVVSLANEVISNPDHQLAQDQFAQSLKELLDSIHATQTALTAEPGEQPPFPTVATSTPISALLNRRQQQQPPLISPVPPPSPPSLPLHNRYIGSLKRKKGKPPATQQQAQDDTDMGDLTAVTPQSRASYGDSYSKTVLTGNAQTQTPHAHSRDSAMQADIRYPSATFGSTTAAVSLSPTASTPWNPDTTGHSNTSTTTAAAAAGKVDKERKAGQRREPDSPTRRTVQAYASPLQKLVTVAKEGQVDSLHSHVTALQARTIRLTGIAESAAGAMRHNTKLMKVLQTKASEVSQLTPQVIEHAEEVVRDPRESHRLGDLQLSSHQWAGHVSQLIEATQKANYPWSMTAKRLVSAVKKGEGLETQMKHVSTQTTKMVDVAMATVTAAETEEVMGVGSGSGDDSEPSHDPELQEQVKHVRVTASEILKLTPQLLSAAEMATSQGEGSATMEHLNLLCQEWATKAKVLLRGVDDISLGMSGPADTLLLSARSGDPTLLTEQSKAITELAASLDTVAQDALEGCEDEKKAEEVRGALERISSVSTQLINCANRVAEEGGGEGDTTTQQLEDLQDTLENTELLRRDWASQVHLITAHVDGLTAKVSAPLDRLVDIALQASRTSSIAKQHLLSMFENKAGFMRDQLEVVESCYQDATADVEQRDAALDSMAMSISFLRKLTPHAVGACRSLASEPGSAMLEHFNHLRRQWCSKAQKLLVSLKRVTTADMEEVLAAFEELIHQSKSGRNTPGRSSMSHKSYSFEDISEEEGTGELVVKEPSKPKFDPRKRYSATENISEASRLVIQASKRPTSMAVPLPSWMAGKDSGSSMTASSQSIAVAAQSLHEVVDEFQEEGNIIITVAKKMSQQMSQMAEFSRGRGELQSKTEMIHTAKAIAANGQVIVRFANVISDQCTDKRMKANLQYCAEMIPTLSTQLRIIASVKASTPDDASADVMLVKNAQNLMIAVIKTMQAAEAACMKGLKDPEDSEQREAANLAVNWKHKLYHQRTMEAISAPRGARGLRKLNRKHISTPSLVDVIQPKTSPL